MARRHGFRATYRAGCRCEPCRLANNAKMREYQARRGGNLNRDADVDRAYIDRVGSGRARYPDVFRRNDQIRRARKLAVETEKFDDAEVFERDDWNCGICFLPVDRSLAYPDDMGASLDHIVPLSFGGSHTRNNTRCAHLFCNISRGNQFATHYPAASRRCG